MARWRHILRARTRRRGCHRKVLVDRDDGVAAFDWQELLHTELKDRCTRQTTGIIKDDLGKSTVSQLGSLDDNKGMAFSS